MELEQIDENNNRLLPVFIKFRVPWFLGGLMVAGIFAAAISSLDSILAALSQQTLAWMKKRSSRSDKENIRFSRMLIVIWALVLCGMASLFHAGSDRATLLIELALAVVGYVSGAILGTFLIAAIPQLRREALGMEWAAALSVMSIFAITRHDPWAVWVLGAACIVELALAAMFLMQRDRIIMLKLAPWIALVFFLNLFQFTNTDGETAHLAIGWPWYATLGCLVMLGVSLTICKPLRNT